MIKVGVTNFSFPTEFQACPTGDISHLLTQSKVCDRESHRPQGGTYCVLLLNVYDIKLLSKYLCSYLQISALVRKTSSCSGQQFRQRLLVVKMLGDVTAECSAFTGHLYQSLSKAPATVRKRQWRDCELQRMRRSSAKQWTDRAITHRPLQLWVSALDLYGGHQHRELGRCSRGPSLLRGSWQLVVAGRRDLLSSVVQSCKSSMFH